MGVLVYNGLRSTDYQVVVEHPPVFTMPERDYEKVHVPGRNGDVIIDNGSYQNSKAKYDICFGSYTKKFPEMVYQVSRWLHSAQGQYARLEDSYDPDHFRLAAYLEENEFENIMFHAGRATVEFDCKPQRYLKSGFKAIEKVAADEAKQTILPISLQNPTIYDSLPLIRIDISNSTEQYNFLKQSPSLVINIGGQGVSVRVDTLWSMPDTNAPSDWNWPEIDSDILGKKILTKEYIPMVAPPIPVDHVTIIIDSSMQEVYGIQIPSEASGVSGKNIANLSREVTFSNLEFPIFNAGENVVSATLMDVESATTNLPLVQIDKVSILPRWWTL